MTKKIDEKIEKYLEEAQLPKEIANDPLYMDVVNAKDEKEAKKAVDKLISVRGKDALNVLKKALKDYKG